MARYYEPPEFADLRELFDPDGVVLAGNPEERRDPVGDRGRLDRFFACPRVFPGIGRSHVTDFNGFRAVVAGENLEACASETDRLAAAGVRPVVLTNHLNVEADRSALKARVTNAKQLRHHATAVDAHPIYASGRLSADYCREWHGVPVRGCGPIPDRGAPTVVCLRFHSDGTISRRGINGGVLGIRAIPGVGGTIAERIADVGYEGREALARATRDDLKKIEGIGDKRATSIHTAARAMVINRVVAADRNGEGRTALPDRSPIGVTVFTHGVNRRIWLLGIADPNRDARASLAVSEDETPALIRGFLNWLAERDGDRPVVAWRGRDANRAFPTIQRTAKKYAPEELVTWRRHSTVDLHDWIHGQNNAATPTPGEDLRLAACATGFSPTTSSYDRTRIESEYRRYAARRARSGREGGNESEQGVTAKDSSAVPDGGGLDWNTIRRGATDEAAAVAHLYERVRRAPVAAEVVV